MSRERRAREAFIDLLLGVLDVDPRTRWTPRQVRGGGCVPFALVCMPLRLMGNERGRCNSCSRAACACSWLCLGEGAVCWQRGVLKESINHLIMVLVPPGRSQQGQVHNFGHLCAAMRWASNV